ncbi:MAG: hypothetical protein Q4G16_05510, partial [Cruoricaptor ignavus]|nr:hypothetical protein [Cruoricaptor ignavus]
LVAFFLQSCKTKIAQNIPVETKNDNTNNNYTRNLIIYYDAEIGNEFLLKSVNDFGAELIYEYKTMNGIAIKIPDEKSMETAISYFEKVKGVLSVQRDKIMQLHSTQNP